MMTLKNIHKDGYKVYCTVYPMDTPDKPFKFGIDVKTREIILNEHNKQGFYTNMARSILIKMYMEYENLPKERLVMTH